MASFSSPRYLFALFLLNLCLEVMNADPNLAFSFKNFGKDSIVESQLALFGDAKVATDNTSVQVSGSGSGRFVCKKPFNLVEGKSRNTVAARKKMKQGLLSWSQCTYTTFLSLPHSTTLKPKIPKSNFSTITATLNSVEESSLTARERRRMRNERRESKPAYNWKEEVEMKLIKKPKKRYATWTEELNLDTLATDGPQWWVVRVSRVTGHETADRMARLIARNFPDMEFKVYVPSVQIKRKLKNGTLSVKPKPLFPGCVFLRCVLNKELHDFIRECDGVGGFVGSKVGNIKRQINKPRPVGEEDIEAMFKQAKEEQEKADRAFEEEQQNNKALDSKDSPLVPENHTPNNASKRPGGRGRKAGKGTSLKLGSTVQVTAGSFAGFSGTLKKLDSKTGLATVGFTLFGQETLADIDDKEIVADTQLMP